MSASSTFLQGLSEQNRERRGLQQEGRENLIKQYTVLRDQAQQVLTSGQAVDKTTGSMRSLTDQEKQQLTDTTTHLTNYIQRLYNPNVSPDTGALSEDPIHKLTDKLHLTRAPKGAPAGESASEIQKAAQGFETQFGPTPAEEGAEKRQETGRDVENAKSLVEKYFPPGPARDQLLNQIVERKLGGAGAVPKPTLKQFRVPKEGGGYTYGWADAGQQGSLPEGAEWLPPAGMQKKSATETTKEAYADSFDPPVENYDDLSPEQKAFYPRWAQMQKEATTQGQHVVLKQDEQMRWVPVTVPTESTRSYPANAPGVPPVPQSLRKAGAASGAAGKGKQGPQGKPAGKTPATPTTSPSAPKKSTGGVSVGGPLFRGPDKNLIRDVGDYRTAVSRARTMDQNLRDVQEAAKQGRADQQAMLSLLFNHIGMTSGAQKGTRITQTMIDEAQNSSPWFPLFAARLNVGDNFDESLLKGIVLTPQQMESMVNLAHEKVQTLAQQVQEEEKSFLPTELNEGGAGGAKRKHSLKKAMSLPFNKGKSEADVRKDLESRGYEVIP